MCVPVRLKKHLPFSLLKTPAMKKHLLLVALCAIPFFLSAQIQLEHTYPNGFLKRVRLDVSGEKYLLKQALCNLSLSNTDHTPFANVVLSSGYYGCVDILFSEHLLDNDDGLEAVFNWFDDGFGFDDGTSVWNNGSEQEISGSGAIPILSAGPGLLPKLLLGTSVFSVSGPTWEHFYGADNSLKRILFPIDGEQYVTHNGKQFDGFHFYDANHNFVKSVNLPILDFKSLNSVTQQYFNDDALMEFFGDRKAPITDASGNARLAEIVREDGATLLSEPCQYVRLSAIPDLPDRLLVYAYSAPGEKQQKVFDAQTLTSLHTFPFYSERISPDGVIDYYLHFTQGKDTMFVYNDDFQLEKTIALSPSIQSNWNVFITRNRFANNGKLEICYATKNSTAPQDSKVVCIDEDGALLYVFPGAGTVKLDQQAGMEDKLFVSYGTSDSTQVYDFTSQTISVPPSPPTVAPKVHPNPFAQFFEIQFPQTGNYALRLTDVAGRVVATQQIQHQQRAAIQTDANWPAGVYFLFVKNEHLQSVVKLVKKD